MTLFHKYLTYANPLLVTDDEDEAGQMERVKAGICETLVLYAQKYDDAFESILPGFVQSTWGLLTNTGLEPKFDIVSLLFLSLCPCHVGEERFYSNSRAPFFSLSFHLHPFRSS